VGRQPDRQGPRPSGAAARRAERPTRVLGTTRPDPGSRWSPRSRQPAASPSLPLAPAAADHAQRALACAAAMQRRQLALNEAAERAGQPAFQLGIGLNTGTVIAGTLGGPGRLDYTVLGDAVNVAQRLQSEPVGGEILAAAVTVRQAGTKLAEPVGPKQLKGRQEPVDIYRIRWLDAPTAQQPGSTAYAE
jgi:class 3 adenylate cyclase